MDVSQLPMALESMLKALVRENIVFLGHIGGVDVYACQYQVARK